MYLMPLKNFAAFFLSLSSFLWHGNVVCFFFSSLMEIPFVSCSLTFTRLTRHIKIALQPSVYATTWVKRFTVVFAIVYFIYRAPFFSHAVVVLDAPHTLHYISSVGMTSLFAFAFWQAKLIKYRFSTMNDWRHSRWQIQIIYECLLCNHFHTHYNLHGNFRKRHNRIICKWIRLIKHLIE